MKYDNGNSYEGDWKNDKFEGKGVIIFYINCTLLNSSSS